MGIKLVEEVMDHAPDTLTAGEWKGLIVLARDANEKTRLTFSKINDPEILRRVRLSVPAWSNLRSALIRKGVLEVVEAGVKGRSARYRIPVMDPKILHPSDEDPEVADEILHPTDEASNTTLHPSDEESAGFFIQQMTPTPLCSSSTSPLPADGQSAAPVAERETIADASKTTTRLTAAQKAVRGVVPLDDEPAFIAWVTAECKVRTPAFWRAAADDMPELAQTWRAKQADDRQRASPSLPDWCGDRDCDPDTRTRDVTDANGFSLAQPCHCHPDYQDAA
jgi:hypothetical protein